MTRRLTRHHARRRGFTLIEVAMAMAIMTVGAVGIMALQQASTRGNQTARQTSTATEVNRVWLERFRRDALMWNNPQPGGRAMTQYLTLLPAGPGATGWFVPTPADVNESYAFDWFGRDTRNFDAVNVGSGNPRAAHYCTQAQLTWVVPERVARADVRTWWWRTGYSLDNVQSAAAQFRDCGVAAPGAIAAALDGGDRRFHHVSGSLLVRFQQVPGT